MIRMIGRRMSHVLTGTGVDDVLVGMSLPSGTVIHDIKLHVQEVGATASLLAIALATMYDIEGYILPVLDPDAAETMDAIWDKLVPKDTDADTMDLDTVAEDTSPAHEPGEHVMAEIVNVGLKPQKIFKRTRLLTAASKGSFAFVEGGAGETGIQLWSPRDEFFWRKRKAYRIRQPSILVFAQSSPALDDTTNTVYTAMTEPKWAQVKYIGNVVMRALMDHLGITETGAESPWEEASALLKEHLEPDVFEETSGHFFAEQFNVTTELMVDHSVPGELSNLVLSSN